MWFSCCSPVSVLLPHLRASLTAVGKRGVSHHPKIVLKIFSSCSHSFSPSLPLSLQTPSPSLPGALKGKHWDNSCQGPGESERREKRGQTVKRAGIQGTAEREAHTHTHTDSHQLKCNDMNMTLHAPTLQPTVCSSLCVCLWNVWHRNYSEEVLLAE